MTTLWIGSYPAAGLGTPVGTGEGVWRAEMAADGSLTAEQVTTQDAPSFVLAHPGGGVLYAVEESGSTALSVRSTADAREMARVAVGGQDGCHLLLSADSRTLYVANYSSGELNVVLLDAAGLPLDSAPQQIWRHEGSGPREDRQEGPHAHFSALSPCGGYVLVCDLGTDQIRRYSIGADGLLADPGIAATLPAGAGPRHLAARGDLLYVVCELDHHLRTYRWDRAAGEADLLAEQPTTIAPQRTGDALYDAHVVLHERPAGDVLLVSVRGADVISVFDVAPEGELTYRAAFDTGYWPRHFAVVGDRLVSVAEKGHSVRSYALADVLGLAPEMENGAIAELPHHSVGVVSPSCIAS